MRRGATRSTGRGGAPAASDRPPRPGRRRRARIGAGDERRELPDTEVRRVWPSARNNVDCCARVCHAPSAAGAEGDARRRRGDQLASTTSTRRAPSWSSGANPTENHPVVGARIRQAAPARRAADRDRSAAHRARGRSGDVHLAPRPGTNIPLLNALAHVIVTEGLVRCARSSPSGVAGFDEFRAFIADWPPERAQRCLRRRCRRHPARGATATRPAARP